MKQVSTKKQASIQLNAVLIPDKKMGGFTAYFKEFPAAIAEGNDKDEAIKNLKQAFFFMLEDLAIQSRAEQAHNDCEDNDHIDLPVNIYA